jgi:hypothetical protein
VSYLQFYVRGRCGDRQESLRQARILERDPKMLAIMSAEVWAGLDDRDKNTSIGSRSAIAAERKPITFVAVDPLLAPYRGDPRFPGGAAADQLSDAVVDREVALSAARARPSTRGRLIDRGRPGQIRRTDHVADEDPCARSTTNVSDEPPHGAAVRVWPAPVFALTTVPSGHGAANGMAPEALMTCPCGWISRRRTVSTACSPTPTRPA